MQHPKFCEYQNIFLLIYLTETNVQYQIKKKKYLILKSEPVTL
jgi:hypothetical protein